MTAITTTRTINLSHWPPTEMSQIAVERRDEGPPTWAAGHGRRSRAVPRCPGGGVEPGLGVVFNEANPDFELVHNHGAAPTTSVTTRGQRRREPDAPPASRCRPDGDDEDEQCRDGVVGDLGGRPPADPGGQTEAGEVEDTALAVQHPQSHEQHEQSADERHTAKSPGLDRVLKDHFGSGPGERGGEQREHRNPHQSERDPPGEDGGEGGQDPDRQRLDPSVLAEHQEEQGDEGGLSRPSVLLAPEEGGEVAVQEALGDEADDGLVGRDRTVEDEPRPEDEAHQPGRDDQDDGDPPGPRSPVAERLPPTAPRVDAVPCRVALPTSPTLGRVSGIVSTTMPDLHAPTNSHECRHHESRGYPPSSSPRASRHPRALRCTTEKATPPLRSVIVEPVVKAHPPGRSGCRSGNFWKINCQ